MVLTKHATCCVCLLLCGDKGSLEDMDDLVEKIGLNGCTSLLAFLWGLCFS